MPEIIENTASELLGQVAEAIEASNKEVRKRVKDRRVEKEINARVDLLDKALQKRAEAHQELRKLKPDVVRCDEDGKVLEESYTKERVKELKKVKERLQKIENAIKKALEVNDFSKLKELK